MYVSTLKRCVSWSVYNWPICSLSEQNDSNDVDSKQTSYQQCIVMRLMSITNWIKLTH